MACSIACRYDAHKLSGYSGSSSVTDQSCIRYAGFPELEGAVRLTQNVNGEARSQLLPKVSHGTDTGEGIHVSSIVLQSVSEC